MNPFVNLLKKSEFREWVAFPFNSMGYRNFAKSLYKASRLNDGPTRHLPRYLLPELWKNLGPRKAVVSCAGSVSFEELSERAVRLSNSFHRQGVTKVDRVATLLNNEQGWFDVMTACMISGIKMPMLNTHLKPDELVTCINNSAPRILVFSAAYLETIQVIENRLDSIELFVCSGTHDDIKGIPEQHPYVTLDELIEAGEQNLQKGGFGLPQMPFSGGSTGVPKFIVEGGNKAVEQRRQKGVSEKDLKTLKAKLVYGISQVGAGKVKGKIVSLIPGPLYHSGVQVAVFPLYFG